MRICSGTRSATLERRHQFLIGLRADVLVVAHHVIADGRLRAPVLHCLRSPDGRQPLACDLQASNHEPTPLTFNMQAMVGTVLRPGGRAGYENVEHRRPDPPVATRRLVRACRRSTRTGRHSLRSWPRWRSRCAANRAPPSPMQIVAAMGLLRYRAYAQDGTCSVCIRARTPALLQKQEGDAWSVLSLMSARAAIT